MLCCQLPQRTICSSACACDQLWAGQYLRPAVGLVPSQDPSVQELLRAAADVPACDGVYVSSRGRFLPVLNRKLFTGFFRELLVMSGCWVLVPYLPDVDASSGISRAARAE